MRVSPDQGLQFAQMLVQDEEPLANINQVKQTLALASHVLQPTNTLQESPSVLCQMWQQFQEFSQFATPSFLQSHSDALICCRREDGRV